jgi:hypothetical protein
MKDVKELNAVELLLELTFTEATPDNSDYTSALTNEVKGRGLAFSNPVKENSPIGRFTFSLGSLPGSQLEALHTGLSERGDLDHLGLRQAVLAEYEGRRK